MGKREKLEKRIREIQFALDLMNEDPEYYVKVLGGKEAMEKWIHYRLEELQKALQELAEEEE